MRYVVHTSERGELYEIERRATNDAERLALQTSQSTEILAKMKAWLTAQPVVKSTSLGQAVRYTLGHWLYFTCFVKDPRIQLDNNPTERALRGPVVGRKNHYGLRSRLGTEAASIFYSLIETAKLHGCDPKRYLAKAVRAGRRGEAVTPWDLA